jgi:hypothetical protein
MPTPYSLVLKSKSPQDLGSMRHLDKLISPNMLPIAIQFLNHVDWQRLLELQPVPVHGTTPHVVTQLPVQLQIISVPFMVSPLLLLKQVPLLELPELQVHQPNSIWLWRMPITPIPLELPLWPPPKPTILPGKRRSSWLKQ